MWPFRSSSADPSHPQPGSAQQPRHRVLVALVCLALVLILLGGWAYIAAPDEAGLRGTAWKHRSAKGTITLEFTRLGYIVGNPVVKYTTSEGGVEGSGSMTYVVLDPKTLSLAGGQRLTIDSISSDNLVLSGGPWKFNKTEFTKQK